MTRGILDSECQILGRIRGNELIWRFSTSEPLTINAEFIDTTDARASERLMKAAGTSPIARLVRNARVWRAMEM